MVGAKRWSGALVAALAMVISATAMAEETSASTQWEMTVGGGVAEVASRDEKGSPLGYAGIGYPLALRVDARGSRWAGGAATAVFFYGFNGGELRADPARDGEENHRADSVFVDLSTWIDRQVWRAGEHRVFAGGQLSHWTFFRNYLYHPAQIGSVETWEATITADVRMGMEGDYGRFSWSLVAHAALVGWVMRPSWAVRGDERIDVVESRTRVLRQGRLATVNRLQMAQAEISTAMAFDQRWGLRAQYRAGWLSHTNQVRTRAFAHSGLLGLRMRF